MPTLLQLALDQGSQVVAEDQKNHGRGTNQNHQVRSGETDAGGGFFLRSLDFFFFSGRGCEQDTSQCRPKSIRPSRAQRRQIHGASGAVDGGQHRFHQALQHPAIALRKRVGLPRENFQNSNCFSTHAHGSSEHGANPQSAATLAIHPSIRLGVVAAQKHAGLYTFPGKTRSHLQACTDWRSVRARTGATNHKIRIFVRHRNRSAGGANQSLGTFRHQLQSPGKI